jgi:hypothetical protein
MDIGKEERTIHVTPKPRTVPAPAKPSRRRPVAPQKPIEAPEKVPVKV